MLGDQIKKYRKEKKMSQEELAIPLNVVRQTVSNGKIISPYRMRNF